MFVHQSPVIEIQGKELQGVKVTVTHFLTGVLVCSGLVTKSARRVLPCARTYAPTHTIIQQYFGHYTARVSCLAM